MHGTKILFAFLFAILILASSFTMGYRLAMNKCLTAECIFEDDSFFLVVDGNLYEWTRHEVI